MVSTPNTPKSFRFAFAILCLLVAGRSLSAADEPILKVVFGTQSTVLSGRVDSTATAEALVATVRTARRDLAPDSSGLAIDPSVKLPSTAEMISLLGELALSTHEGRFELWPDHLVIGGLTDSIVTQSALRIRVAPLLEGRALHSRICIVSTEDLPEIAVSLADGQAPAMEASVVAAPVPETPFEAPGIRLEKLLATIQLLGNLHTLAGNLPPAAPSVPIQAAPLPPAGPATAAAPTVAPMITATPVENLESLPSVRFSSNSFLLQANQNAILDQVAKQLLDPSRIGAPVRIEAVKPSGGSPVFNEYLCERRAAEVTRLLGERGVESTRFSAKTVSSSSPIDSGEVRLFVEVPPLPEPAPPATGAVAP